MDLFDRKTIWFGTIVSRTWDKRISFFLPVLGNSIRNWLSETLCIPTRGEALYAE